MASITIEIEYNGEMKPTRRIINNALADAEKHIHTFLQYDGRPNHLETYHKGKGHEYTLSIELKNVEP